jgi:uncharacterized protein YfaA (DUF2138 family)
LATGSPDLAQASGYGVPCWWRQMLKLSLPIALRQRRTGFYLLLGLLASLLVFGAYRYWHRAPHYKGVSRLQVDLRQPEMLLVTRNLSALPKDIAAAPLLAGLVDEQLVFHYEEDEARLSIEGSLRRLAYEHKLGIEDRFLSTLLAGPAEIGFWRSGKGRPEHVVVRLERGVLARLTEALARIALDDRQLKQAGKFSVGGDEVTLYTLDYGGGRTLAFAGRGDNWVFLSDPALALDIEGKLTADAEVVLGDLLHGSQPWQAKLPASTTAQHSFVVGQRALTMGYEHFLPTLAGLRFDHEGGRWQARLRLQPTKPPVTHDMAEIWRAVPLGAAFCTALPVDWQAAAAPLATLLGSNPAISPTLAALDPIAAVCWYASSRLAAPLLIARATGAMPPDAGQLLAQLAEKSWSASAAPAAGNDGEGQVHVATVASRHGIRPPDGGARAFEPALAQHAGLILFSPDRRQVDAALAVAARRAAALGDEAGLRGPGWLVLDPPLLARLIRSEVQEVLPADEESFFRDVARNRLWPRLEAWAREQPAVVAIPGAVGADGFVALDIRPLQESPR